MLESFEHAGKIIEIHVDENPISPRKDCENYDTIIAFHKHYKLGDSSDYCSSNFNGWDELENKIKKDNDILEILPLYMYDHSGITISTTPFSDRWDSGQIGFIFTTKQQARQSFMVKRITKKITPRVHDSMLSSVKVYDEYLRGEVYGYVIKDKETDEVLDSCWGFFGYDYVTKEAKETAQIVIKPEENPNQTQLALKTA